MSAVRVRAAEVLADHEWVELRAGGRCHCGADTFLDEYGHSSHQADALLEAGLLRLEDES